MILKRGLIYIKDIHVLISTTPQSPIVHSVTGRSLYVSIDSIFESVSMPSTTCLKDKLIFVELLGQKICRRTTKNFNHFSEK